MKNVRKLVLVPIELWEKVKKDIPKTEHYTNMEVKVEQAPQMKVMKVMKSGENVTMKQTQKMKITRNYNMKWTSDGTFKYRNKIIPKSNIHHLVLHALLKM